MKKIYIYLPIILIFIVGCEKDELPISEEILDVKDVKIEKVPFGSLPTYVHDFFRKSALETKGKEGKSFGLPRTNVSAIKHSIPNGKTSYTISLKKIPGEFNEKSYFDNMVIIKISQNMEKIRILRYLPNKEWSDSVKNVNKFSGTIEFYSKKGKFLGKLEMLDGKGKKEEQQDLKASSTTCTYTSGDPICTGDLIGEGTYTCAIKYTESCTTTFTPDSGPTGNNNENETIDQGDSGLGGGGVTTPIPDEEVKVDDSELEGKEKCLNDLLKQKGDSYIQNLLNNFRGNSEFDIKIGSKENIWNPEKQKYVNGQTDAPVNNLIRIDISSFAASKGSALWVVRTLLHEYIHADIFRKLNTQLITNDILDFRTTFEQYERDHHETMGALYITSMRDALKGFHQNILIDDYNAFLNWYGAPTDDFYEALAWQSLKDNKIKAYNELSNEKKQSIENEEQKLGILKKGCPQN